MKRPVNPPLTGDAPPDAAWYERMRLRGEARARDASLSAMRAAGPPVPPVPDQPAAWQKVGRALGDVAGRVVEKVLWQRGRVFNPKILQVDVKPPKRLVPPPSNWANDAAENFRRERVVNADVSLPYFRAVVLAIEKIASDGWGFVQRAFKSIGRLAGLGRGEDNWGRETVRKCIRWLEEHGWIGTLNALYRDEDRALKRDANVYQLFGKHDAAEIAALAPEARAVKRESLTLSRGAALFGLALRPWGLNATPAPSNRHQVRTLPAPA